ncbi:two-component sensor histidine kinase [Psychrosphaera sp. F3M07]|uniref:ATP-binding protein n=2 Tax=Psychrosphaera TaxID=907197 RepID=UPI001C07F530|nr:ATP-binding protein [Psychrosphaera sp. F3M07]MBU2918253.1 two-component sensor histidine kinase [Psychrosphaera sp. F3M07]
MRWLVGSLIAAILFATVGLGWLFDTIYLQYIDDKSNKQSDVVSVMEQLGDNVSQLINSSNTPHELLASWPEANDYQLTLQSVDNMPLPTPLLNQFINEKRLVLETKDHIEINFYLPAHDQRLILTAPISHAVNEPRSSAYLFTGLFYFTLLLLMLLWLNPLIKRLLILRKTAKAFGEGNLEQRVKLGSVSYIRDLEFEFNRMAQRIDDLVSDVKLLSSAVSHDLRTPLSSIRFGIDTLQEVEEPELRKRFEQLISKDVDSMIELVETLLNYARLDQAMLNIDKSKIAVAPLINQIFESKRSDTISFSLISDVNTMELEVFADKGYLQMLLNNLIQNALQYAVSQVTVTLKKLDHGCEIIIADDGAGIPETERENIVKPFIRGDKTRSSVKGFGIGLAIVNRILHWHGGRLEIGQDEQLLGAKLTVFLPH